MQVLLRSFERERTFANVRSSVIMNEELFSSARVFTFITSNADGYNAEMVKEILRANAEPDANAPKGEAELMDWLDSP